MHLKNNLSTRFGAQIFHPISRKIFILIFYSRIEETTPYMRENMEDIPKRCDPNQIFKHAVVCFESPLGKERLAPTNNFLGHR